MSHPERSPLAWVGLGLLAALVATNATFLVLQRAGGPLIGMGFYGVLLVLAWRGWQRNRQTVMVGGLLGLAVHGVEVVALGWSAYPVLMALNLILPAALAGVAWAAGYRAQHMDRGT
jgi:hypothetical protein